MKRMVLWALLAVTACGRPESNVPLDEPAGEPAGETPAGRTSVDPAATMPLTLRAKFEPVESDVLHAAPPTDLDGEGLFVGNDLGPEDYPYLDEQLLAMVGYEGLFACVELEDGYFVLRGPGADAPTDLFLARWESGQRILTWIADLAFAHCGDEECSREESWLVDLDHDGRRDLVRRGRIEEIATGEVDETFDAWVIDAGGVLDPITIPVTERSRYRMD